MAVNPPKDKTKKRAAPESQTTAPVSAAQPALSGQSMTDILPARGVYTDEARLLRLKHLKAKTGADLSWIEGSRIGANEVRGNIENFIGSIEIPVAVAGPLRILFEDSVESVYAPIATTEGALVASITRGAKALSATGGVTVRFLEQKMTRAPLFELADLDSAIAFSRWVVQHLEAMQKEVRSLSRYSSLEKVEPVLLGRSVHLVFCFTTTDAAGQNMSTICSWKLSKWIKDELKESNPSLRAKIKDFCLEGGLSSDKKVSFRNVIQGRGSRVLAECKISAEILERTLKVTPEYLATRYHRGMSAAIHSGFLGYNINAANVVAGIFAATGQDIACVHESSVAQLHMEVEDGSLYVSYLMPNLVVGSVGGGLSLKPQREMLAIMGCDGPGKSRRLAEIITAYALALDLSTVTALLSGHFATAHERLGRKNDQRWLSQTELMDQYLKPMFQARLDADDQLESITRIDDLKIGDSIVVEFSTRVSSRLCGFQAYSAKTALGREFRIFAKIKPSSEEILLAGELMAGLADSEIGRLFKGYQLHSPFFQCETRELHAYRIQDPRFTSIAPRCFGVVEDHEREIYILFEELLEDVELKDSAEHPERWEPRHLEEAIRGIAGFHSIHYGRDDNTSWIGESPSLGTMKEISEFLGKVFEFGRREESSWLSEDLAAVHERALETLTEWWGEIENHPKTWIHNDFNPRNIAFRKDGRVVAYDWELLTRHLPQRDLMEFLAFVVESPTLNDILGWCELHRSLLEKESGKVIDREKWLKGSELALKDFLVHRLALYFLLSPHREVSFLPRVYRNTVKMIRLLEGYRETS